MPPQPVSWSSRVKFPFLARMELNTKTGELNLAVDSIVRNVTRSLMVMFLEMTSVSERLVWNLRQAKLFKCNTTEVIYLLVLWLKTARVRK